jgi:hypothetical protein
MPHTAHQDARQTGSLDCTVRMICGYVDPPGSVRGFSEQYGGSGIVRTASPLDILLGILPAPGHNCGAREQ